MNKAEKNMRKAWKRAASKAAGKDIDKMVDDYKTMMSQVRKWKVFGLVILALYGATIAMGVLWILEN
jgi:hypothetical protein